MKNFVEIKICGITNIKDLDAALAFGADYAGFVLYDGSPRGITPIEMIRMLDAVEKGGRFVGVFVNTDRREVEKIALDAGLSAVQICGHERADDFREMAVPLWRSVHVPVKNGGSGEEEWDAERYVIDATVSGMYGGTGRTADWEAAAGFARGRQVMLAGGLTPGNVEKAIDAVCPVGVDTASGVESSPGRKDIDRMKEFISAVRGIAFEKERGDD